MPSLKKGNRQKLICLAIASLEGVLYLAAQFPKFSSFSIGALLYLARCFDIRAEPGEPDPSCGDHGALTVDSCRGRRWLAFHLLCTSAFIFKSSPAFLLMFCRGEENQQAPLANIKKESRLWYKESGHVTLGHLSIRGRKLFFASWSFPRCFQNKQNDTVVVFSF